MDNRLTITRAGAMAAVLGGSLALSGCWGWPPGHGQEGDSSPGPQRRLDAAQSFAAVGESVKLAVRYAPTGCAPSWSVAPSGAGLSSPTVTGALLRPNQPGHFVVSYRCGDSQLQTAIDGFLPTISVLAEPPTPLAVTCSDAAFTKSGRILCVNQGVTVLDPKSGLVLGKTVEGEPVMWGIDAQDDLFATASGGCASCGPVGQPVSPGALLYSLSHGDTPELLARLTSTPAEEVGFAGDRLYVTTTSQVVQFDIGRPTLPQQLGCIAGPLEESLPRQIDGTLFTSSYAKLRSFSLSSFEPHCDEPQVPLGQLPVSQLLSVLPPAMATQAGFVYLGLPTQLQVVDGRDPVTLQRAFSANMPLLGLGANDGRLFVAADGKLYVLELSQPGQPKPIGLLTLPNHSRTYFGVVDGKLRMLSGNQLWTLSIR